MKKNKGKKILFIVLILIAIAIAVYFFLFASVEKEVITEYTPEAEITEEDLRQTFVSLYFKDKETGKLKVESRVIDAKKLLNDPYQELITMLLAGPLDETLESVIPKGTTLQSTQLQNGVLHVNFSKEFLQDVEGKEQEEAIIYSIVNTLTELTEVNSVKFLIEGEEASGFADGEVTFEKNFVRDLEK